MKLEGQITILINREYTSIEIIDKSSGIRFVEVKLTPEQLSSALARIAYTDCELSVVGLEKIGKKHEWKSFRFEIPKELYSYNYKKYAERDAKLTKFAQDLLDKDDEGWISDGYFGAQDSFSEDEGRYYAKCTVRRYV